MRIKLLKHPLLRTFIICAILGIPSIMIYLKVSMNDNESMQESANNKINPKIKEVERTYQKDDSTLDTNEIHIDSNTDQSKSDSYDWLKDTQIEPTQKRSLHVSKTDQSDINEETYPPKNWHQTKDIELYFTYYHAQLIKQFGDIDQVRTVVDTEYKIKNDVELKIDEEIEYLEAQNYLWPDERTQEALNHLIQSKYSEEHQSHIHLDDHSH